MHGKMHICFKWNKSCKTEQCTMSSFSDKNVNTYIIYVSIYIKHIIRVIVGNYNDG